MASVDSGHLLEHLLSKRADRDYYGYSPSLAAAIVSCLVFITIAVLLTIQIRRARVKYPIIIAIGAYCESLGYVFRALGATGGRQSSFALYLLMQLFIILSPLAFMAGLYVIYGRLVRRMDSTGEEKTNFSPLPARWYARTFVGCDILSFLIQGGGSGLLVSDDPTTSRTGSRILLGGLAFGLLSFALFVGLTLWMCYTVSKCAKKGTLRTLHLTDDWRLIMVPVLVSSVCILVRTVFRLIEFQEGYDGHIYNTEWYLYVFDTIFMAIAAGIWIPFFPAKFGLDQSLSGAPDLYPLNRLDSKGAIIEDIQPTV